MRQVPENLRARLRKFLATMWAFRHRGIAVYDEGYSLGELVDMYPNRFEPDTLHNIRSLSGVWKHGFLERSLPGWFVATVKKREGSPQGPQTLVHARVHVVTFLGLSHRGLPTEFILPTSSTYFPGTITCYLPCGDGQDYRIWMGVDAQGRIIMRQKSMVAKGDTSLMILRG
jgi:hypothetical protein